MKFELPMNLVILGFVLLLVNAADYVSGMNLLGPVVYVAGLVLVVLGMLMYDKKKPGKPARKK